MKARKALSALLGASLLASFMLTPQAMAAPPSPVAAWAVQSLPVPTNFKPGDVSGKDEYEVFVTNSGGASTDHSTITITDTLPAGIGVVAGPGGVGLSSSRSGAIEGACKTTVAGEVSTVTCEVTDALVPGKEPARLDPGEELVLQIHVTVPASAAGTLVNQVAVKGGGAKAVTGESQNQATDAEPSAGFQEFKAELTGPDGLPVTAADSHPYQYTTSFAVHLVPAPPRSSAAFLPAQGDLKEIEVALPPGLVGNPTAADLCTPQQFNTIGEGFVNDCPRDSRVGTAAIQQLEGRVENSRAAIYNLTPPKGMPAQFGFHPAVGVPVYIDTELRTGSDYGITARLRNVTEAERVSASRVTFWGNPADPSHGLPPSGLDPVKPFLRLPSSCADPLLTRMLFETWSQPSISASQVSGSGAPDACEAPDFSPSIAATPTTNVADSPSGLHFNLHLPQKEHEDPAGVGEADLKEAKVTLPGGLVVNPASADGLGACSPEQIGLTSAVGQLPARFTPDPANCPNAAKIGTVEVQTPLIDHPLPGAVYLAQQSQNPFNSLLAIYVAIYDPVSGVVVKLPGKVEPDPKTGQLSTTVSESPQTPFEDFRFDFFEGARAPLRTPASCGRHTTQTRMTPWTAPAGASSEPSDSFAIASGPGGACPSGALEPKLSARLGNFTAATYSPFSLRLTRPDGSGEFAALQTTAPSGLTAKLAGVPYCPQAAIDQASSRSNPGQGRLEAAQPSCPAASQVGTISAGAGAGPSPFYTAGKLYLAGPYKGAPLSFVAIVPAVAGPFDLGAILNRIALQVNPETAQVSALSDPLPMILSGIPVDLRDLRVNIDRPNFTLSGTSCDPTSALATVTGVSGATATVSDRFQLGGCAALRFKPALSLKLSGGTKRSAHPALRAVVSYPKGANYANTARASVALPHSEFLDQAHIRTICTRVQFAANACPKGSIYGKARAITPILDKPLTGPVYLRSSSHPLPDLVMSLRGQIDAAAVGRFDTHNGGIRTTFDAVPDVPLTKVVLEMQGAKKGLLVNSRNICKHTNRATVRFGAHNGKTYDFRPVLKDSCKGKPKAGKGKGGHR